MGVTKTQVVKYIRKGDKGDKGAALRGPQAWSDCAVGYSFEAGGQGDKWQDVVIYGNQYYECIKNHAKTANNYPGSSADQTNKYWRLSDKIGLVATNILLATYALVKNLGVEAIDMKDANGNVLFQAKDGVVTCKTGVFDNVTIQSGNIAGFKISGNGLTNEPFTNDAYVIFRNDPHGAFAGIGGDILPASTGARGVARFENHDTSDWYGLGINYAALLSAQGAADNRALSIDGGTVSGFAMQTSLILTSKTLSRTDYQVLLINESADITITLPTMQLYDNGHVIRIKRLGAKGVTINVGYCYTGTPSSSRYTKPCIIYDKNDTAQSVSLISACDAFELVWCRDLVRTVGSTTYYGAWVQYKLPRDW